ncbi:MAG: hypothetical protein CM15mV130_030 [Caudoviricetes sp.]|nr:MAG: hypothetical protein CM15mV130_030 [Caudoviricetes sp.]
MGSLIIKQTSKDLSEDLKQKTKELLCFRIIRFSSEENSTHGILSIVNDDGSKTLYSWII